MYIARYTHICIYDIHTTSCQTIQSVISNTRVDNTHLHTTCAVCEYRKPQKGDDEKKNSNKNNGSDASGFFTDLDVSCVIWSSPYLAMHPTYSCGCSPSVRTTITDQTTINT